MLLLAACGEEATPATATSAPATASLSTTLATGEELTLAYPADWVAEEIQTGQIEIATNRDALQFLTDAEMTLNPADIAGQISLFTDAEVEANAGVGPDATPVAALSAIVAAFGLSTEDTPQNYAANGTPAAILTSTLNAGASERSLYFVLVDFDGARAFLFFSAEGDPGVTQYEAEIRAIADSMTYKPGE